MFAKLKQFFKEEETHRDWHIQNWRTPDLWQLSQHARQNVFFPDDMKIGKINHKLISDHIPVHPDAYTLSSYRVFQKDLGEHSVPLLFDSTVDFGLNIYDTPEPARVKGELYSLPSALLWKVLDIHKQNTVQFVRQRVSITLPYREVIFTEGVILPKITKDQLKTVPAHMYVAVPEYWGPRLGSILGTKPVQLLEPNSPKVWIERYYKF